MNVLNFSGQSCPTPVIETKKALIAAKDGDEFEIIVDNVPASQNIERLLNTLGQTFTQNELKFYVSKSPIDEAVANPAKPASTQGECVMMSSQKWGDGHLGELLVVGFLTGLKERNIKKIVLVNDAVFMVCDEGHPAFEAMQALIDSGVDVMCCSSCLNYFGIMPIIGRSAASPEVIETMFNYKTLSL